MFHDTSPLRNKISLHSRRITLLRKRLPTLKRWGEEGFDFSAVFPAFRVGTLSYLWTNVFVASNFSQWPTTAYCVHALPQQGAIHILGHLLKVGLIEVRVLKALLIDRFLNILVISKMDKLHRNAYLRSCCVTFLAFGIFDIEIHKGMETKFQLNPIMWFTQKPRKGLV